MEDCFRAKTRTGETSGERRPYAAEGKGNQPDV